MRYAVVIPSKKGGEGEIAVVKDDEAQAMVVAQELAAKGTETRIFQEMGMVVLSAKVVPITSKTNGSNGHATAAVAAPVRPIRTPAVVEAAAGSKRTPEALAKIRTRILSWLATNSERGVEEMSRALGVETKDLVLPLRQLKDEGRIKQKGQARAVKYFLPKSRPAPAKAAPKKASRAA